MLQYGYPAIEITILTVQTVESTFNFCFNKHVSLKTELGDRHDTPIVLWDGSGAAKNVSKI